MVVMLSSSQPAPEPGDRAVPALSTGRTPAPNHPQGPRFSPRPLLSHWVLSLAAQP